MEKLKFEAFALLLTLAMAALMSYASAVNAQQIPHKKNLRVHYCCT
jgi:hypothetical protein